MCEELKFKVTPSKKIDNNKLLPHEIDFIKVQNDSSNLLTKENIRKIFSSELSDQTSSITFFEYQLKYHEIILPDEYLAITLDIFQAHLDNKDLIKTLLEFYRHCTGFESEMQDYLIEKEIIKLVIPFFPEENALAILGNLSIKSTDILNQLLTMDILDQIYPLINIFKEENQNTESLDNFGNSVDLLDSLLYNFDGEDFSIFIPKFIELFDIICSAYKDMSVNQAKRIAETFLHYINADPAFIQSFFEKQQLKIFLENDFANNKIYEFIIQIMASIINEYDYQGASYIYKLDIMNWIGRLLFSDSQEVVYRCFSILNQIIVRCDPPFVLANECIENDFLIKAMDKFYSEVIYRLKITLYEFVCTLFSNVSDDQIPLMIEEKALDLIIDNYELIYDQQNCPLIWNSLERLLPFKNADAEGSEEIPEKSISTVNDAIIKLKGNAVFIDWMLNCRDSESSLYFDWHDEVLTLFLGGHEDQQL